MSYPLFRLVHIFGFIILGGGLIGVFVADLRTRQSRDIRIIAEACRYVAILYDGVVVPGAILAGLSGLLMTLESGAGFFDPPWLTGMWALFLFELVEGNTITRLHFRRMLRMSKDALAKGTVTGDLLEEQNRRLPSFTHFLDLPLFFLIVTFGGLRPSSWAFIIVGVLSGVVLGAVLYLVFTRAYRTG